MKIFITFLYNSEKKLFVIRNKGLEIVILFVIVIYKMRGRKKVSKKKSDIVLKVKSVNNISKKPPAEVAGNVRGNSIEKYLATLEREIGSLESVIEKEKEYLPEKIEQAIKEIIKEEFKAKRFNAFIAQDLFSAYIEAGGRELLKKTLKQSPRNVMSLLKMIIDIGNSENKTPQNATQVVVNIDMGSDK